jgi:hypothetical protein
MHLEPSPTFDTGRTRLSDHSSRESNRPRHETANALNYLEQARSLLSPVVQAQGQMQMNALLEIVIGLFLATMRNGLSKSSIRWWTSLTSFPTRPA